MDIVLTLKTPTVHFELPFEKAVFETLVYLNSCPKPLFAKVETVKWIKNDLFRYGTMGDAVPNLYCIKFGLKSSTDFLDSVMNLTLFDINNSDFYCPTTNHVDISSAFSALMDSATLNTI